MVAKKKSNQNNDSNLKEETRKVGCKAKVIKIHEGNIDLDDVFNAIDKINGIDANSDSKPKIHISGTFNIDIEL